MLLVSIPEMIFLSFSSRSSVAKPYWR